MFAGSGNGDKPQLTAKHFVTFCCPPGLSFQTPQTVNWWAWGAPFQSGAYQYVPWWHQHDFDTFGRARYDQAVNFRLLTTAWNVLADKRLPGWQTLMPGKTSFSPRSTALQDWPYLWPQLFPELVPPQSPTPDLEPIPYRWLPRLRPFPLHRAPSEAPARGYSPPGGRRPPDEGGPNQEPRPDGEPLGRPKQADNRARRQPPTERRDNAQKAGGKGAGVASGIAGILKKAAEAGMEAVEAIDALYWSLPPSRRSKNERTASARLLQVLKNSLAIDWFGHQYTRNNGTKGWSPGALERLMANAVEDRAYGKLGQAQQQWARTVFNATGYNILNPGSRTLGNINRAGKMGGLRMGGGI